MDQELQQAIQTFGMVPEFYQKAFKEAGADFPDELVNAIKADPNKAGEMVTKDKNLQQAVLTIFKSNKDNIMKYIQQQSSSMFKEGGKLDYLRKKLQSGGQLTRKQALEQAQTNRGFTKSQARTAYRNARNAGLDRQAALAAIIGQPQEVTTESTTVERPTLINNVSAPIGRAITTTETISARPTTNYNNVDFGVFNFEDAFGRASKAGLNEFTWNGKRYTTQKAVPALGPDGRNYSTADTLRQNGNISNTNWWISKQWEPQTAMTIGVNPWPAIHAQERSEYVSSRKQGGKLEKENEINKKYIKDSEKAGEKASKKMSDLKPNTKRN